MKQKRTLHKALSMLITAAMVFSTGLSPIRADGASLDISGLRICHTEHNEDCGYSETTAFCTHTCEQCEVLDTGEPAEKDCTCEVAESGEIVHGKDCQFYTATEMGEAMKTLIALVDELPNVEDITEENKETIIPIFKSAAEAYETLDNKEMVAFEQIEQYKKLMALTAIMKNIDAEQCEVLDTGKLVEKDCTCEAAESGEIVHGEDCQFYTVAEISEAMKTLIALVNELPNVEDITEENKETIIPTFEASAEAYEILDNKEMAAFEQIEQYKKLIAITAIMKNIYAEPKVLECICPLDGGSTIHTDSACPFYGLRVSTSKGRLAGAPHSITVEIMENFVYNIYANGNPIIIKEGISVDSYSYIYIDSNKNGKVDEEETPVELLGVFKASGEGFGYFLVNSSIFGGCKADNLSGDTFVTIESGKVANIYGGGFTGNTGDVNLSLSGTAVVRNTVFGGAKSGGEVGVTNINIGGKAWLNYVYGGAEAGTTGNTNIIIADSESRAQSVYGGGHGGSGLANSGDSAITVNKNIFFSKKNDDLTNGGWIYGGGYSGESSIANSTINLNYDDRGEFGSSPMVCGAGNIGSITGNSTINIQKYAPSDIYCGGYSGNVKGTVNVNVTAQGFFHPGYYTISGFKGDGETNKGGENTITFTNVGNIDKGTWAGITNKVDNIILENSNLSMYGNTNNTFTTKNLTVDSDSSLTVSLGYLGVTGDFTGGRKHYRYKPWVSFCRWLRERENNTGL